MPIPAIGVPVLGGAFHAQHRPVRAGLQPFGIERREITEIAASPRIEGLPSRERSRGPRGRSPDSGLGSGRGIGGSLPRADPRAFHEASPRPPAGPKRRWSRLLLGSLGRAARRPFSPVGTPRS